MYRARVRMPRMGTSVHESTVIEWKISVGDQVSKGDPLVSAESDKVEFEIEAPSTGVVKEILVDPESTVPVGEVLAVLETKEEVVENQTAEDTSPSGPPKASEWVAPVAPNKPREKPATPPSPSRPTESLTRIDGGNRLLSPRVQRLAIDHGLDITAISSIPGTGSGGRVTARDLKKFIAEEKDALPQSVPLSFSPITEDKEREVHVPFSRLRRRIAENLTRSVSEIPQATTYLEIDMSRVVSWRDANKDSFAKKYDAKLTFTPFFVLAIIAALRNPDNARMNGSCEDGILTIKRYVNLGLAVDSPEGLVVPVLAGADGMNFVNLTQGLADISKRAREGDLSPAEVKDGTITLTNFGTSGALFGNPIINPPQVAIIGTGTISPRPVALSKGRLGVKPTMGLSTTFDHRANDGMAAGHFAASIQAAIEGLDFSQLEY